MYNFPAYPSKKDPLSCRFCQLNPADMPQRYVYLPHLVLLLVLIAPAFPSRAIWLPEIIMVFMITYFYDIYDVFTVCNLNEAILW